METNKQKTWLLLSVTAAGVLFLVTFSIFPIGYDPNLRQVRAEGTSVAAVILAALSVLSSKHWKPFLIASAFSLCFVVFSRFPIYFYVDALAVAVLAILQVTRRQREKWSQVAYTACLCVAVGWVMWQLGSWGQLFPVLLLGIIWILGVLCYRCPHVGVFTLLAAAAGMALSFHQISQNHSFYEEMRGSYVWFNFLQIILEGVWPVLLAFAVQPKVDAIHRKITTSIHVLCPECGGINESDAKFCILCGAPLSAVKTVRSCPACGAECHSQAKFCPACGKALPVPEQPKQGSPDAGTKKQIIQ